MSKSRQQRYAEAVNQRISQLLMEIRRTGLPRNTPLGHALARYLREQAKDDHAEAQKTIEEYREQWHKCRAILPKEDYRRIAKCLDPKNLSPEDQAAAVGKKFQRAHEIWRRFEGVDKY